MDRFILALRRLVLAGLVLATVLIFYMSCMEPYRLQTRTMQVDLVGFDSQVPLRVLHLSDLHYTDKRSLRHIDKAIHNGLALQPDLICITGDFITRKLDNPAPLIQALQKLSQTAPTVACLGNHDGGSWAIQHGSYATIREIQDILQRSDVTCLVDEAIATNIDGRTIECVGLSDYWAGKPQVAKAFEKLDSAEDTLRIVLSHNPDARVLTDNYAWDLMLCGHTHGGQMELPILGTPFAPVADHTFVSGINEWKGRHIHTTDGIGNVYGLRFNCPPAIDLLELH